MKEKEDNNALWRETVFSCRNCSQSCKKVFIYILPLLVSRLIMKIVTTVLIFSHRKLLHFLWEGLRF